MTSENINIQDDQLREYIKNIYRYKRDQKTEDTCSQLKGILRISTGRFKEIRKNEALILDMFKAIEVGVRYLQKGFNTLNAKEEQGEIDPETQDLRIHLSKFRKDVISTLNSIIQFKFYKYIHHVYQNKGYLDCGYVTDEKTGQLKETLKGEDATSYLKYIDNLDKLDQTYQQQYFVDAQRNLLLLHIQYLKEIQSNKLYRFDFSLTREGNRPPQSLSIAANHHLSKQTSIDEILEWFIGIGRVGEKLLFLQEEKLTDDEMHITRSLCMIYQPRDMSEKVKFIQDKLSSYFVNKINQATRGLKELELKKLLRKLEQLLQYWSRQGRVQIVKSVIKEISANRDGLVLQNNRDPDERSDIKMLDKLITSWDQAIPKIEYENFLPELSTEHNVEITTVSDMDHQLSQIQSQLQEAINEPDIDIAHTLRIYTSQSAEFARKMLEECENWLGVPPCAFHVTISGSTSRNQFIPGSDLDFAVIIENLYFQADPYFKKLMFLWKNKLEHLPRAKRIPLEEVDFKELLCEDCSYYLITDPSKDEPEDESKNKPEDQEEKIEDKFKEFTKNRNILIIKKEDLYEINYVSKNNEKRESIIITDTKYGELKRILDEADKINGGIFLNQRCENNDIIKQIKELVIEKKGFTVCNGDGNFINTPEGLAEYCAADGEDDIKSNVNQGLYSLLFAIPFYSSKHMQQESQELFHRFQACLNARLEYENTTQTNHTSRHQQHGQAYLIKDVSKYLEDIDDSLSKSNKERDLLSDEKVSIDIRVDKYTEILNKRKKALPRLEQSPEKNLISLMEYIDKYIETLVTHEKINIKALFIRPMTQIILNLGIYTGVIQKKCILRLINDNHLDEESKELPNKLQEKVKERQEIILCKVNKEPDAYIYLLCYKNTETGDIKYEIIDQQSNDVLFKLAETHKEKFSENGTLIENKQLNDFAALYASIVTKKGHIYQAQLRDIFEIIEQFQLHDILPSHFLEKFKEQFSKITKIRIKANLAILNPTEDTGDLAKDQMFIKSPSIDSDREVYHRDVYISEGVIRNLVNKFIMPICIISRLFYYQKEHHQDHYTMLLVPLETREQQDKFKKLYISFRGEQKKSRNYHLISELPEGYPEQFNKNTGSFILKEEDFYEIYYFSKQSSQYEQLIVDNIKDKTLKELLDAEGKFSNQLCENEEITEQINRKLTFKEEQTQRNTVRKIAEIIWPYLLENSQLERQIDWLYSISDPDGFCHARNQLQIEWDEQCSRILEKEYKEYKEYKGEDAAYQVSLTWIDGKQRQHQCMLSKTWRDKIIDQDGNLRESDGDGQRLVIALSDENGHIIAYLKVWTEMPGYQYLVDEITWSIAGHGIVTNIGYINIYSPSGEHSDPIPVILSYPADQSLAQVMGPKAMGTAHQASNLGTTVLEKLDDAYLALFTLVTMYINEEDGNWPNHGYQSYQQPNGEIATRLLRFDGDHAFVNELDEHIIWSKFRKAKLANVKSVILSLEHVHNHQPLSPSALIALEQFTHQDPNALMHHWLTRINQYNQTVMRLFTEEQIKKYLDSNQSFLPCLMTPNLQQWLFFRAHHLRRFIHAQKHKFTFSNLFEHALPLAYSIYQPVCEDKKLNIVERFEQLPNNYRTDCDGNKESTLTTRNFLEHVIENWKEWVGKDAHQTLLEKQDRLNDIYQQLCRGFKDESLASRLPLFLQRLIKPQPDAKKEESLFELMGKIPQTDFIIPVTYFDLRSQHDLYDNIFNVLIQKLPKLEVLYISECRKLTDDAFLILSKAICPLRNLIANKLSIKKIDVELETVISVMLNNNDDLQYLKLDAPKLNTLSLRGCTSLETLAIDAPRLRNIDIAIAGCYGLKSIRVGLPLPIFGDDWLKDYPNLTDIEGISINIIQQIKENISMEEAGLTLNIKTQSAASINWLKLVSLLSKRSDIQAINIDIQFLDHSRAQALGSIIQQNPHIHTVILDGALIKAPKLRTLGNFNFHRFWTMEWYEHLSHDKGWLGIYGLLQVNKLFLRRSYILAAAMQTNASLTQVNLFNKIQGSRSGQMVVNVLLRINTLTVLDLANNHMDTSGNDKSAYIALANLLQYNRTLTHLNLRDSNLGNRGGKAISSALISNKTLAYLDMSRTFHVKYEAFIDSYISRGTMRILSTALQANNTLIELHLSKAFGYNKKGDRLTLLLAEGLAHNGTLKTLTLRENEIGNKGAKAIAGILSNEMTTLAQLSLGKNDIDDEGIIALAHALRKNKTLKVLNLSGGCLLSSGNHIRNTGMMAIAYALEENSHLFHLGLGWTEVENLSLEYMLAVVVHRNNTLGVLDLNHGEIRTQIKHHLAPRYRQAALGFLEAIKNEDHEGIYKYMQLCVCPISYQIEGMNLHMHAVQGGSLAVVEQLLRYDESLRYNWQYLSRFSVEKELRSSLDLAIQLGAYEIAQLIANYMGVKKPQPEAIIGHAEDESQQNSARTQDKAPNEQSTMHDTDEKEMENNNKIRSQPLPLTDVLETDQTSQPSQKAHHNQQDDPVSAVDEKKINPATVLTSISSLSSKTSQKDKTALPIESSQSQISQDESKDSELSSLPADLKTLHINDEEQKGITNILNSSNNSYSRRERSYSVTEFIRRDSKSPVFSTHVHDHLDTPRDNILELQKSCERANSI